MRGADGLEQENPTAEKESLVSRNNRVKRIKITIIVLIVIFLFLPTILCIIMFFKVQSLQKQIDVLMIERYGVTYNELFEKNHESIAHAAVVQYNTSSSVNYTLDEAVKASKGNQEETKKTSNVSNMISGNPLENKPVNEKVSEKVSEKVYLSEKKYIFDSSKTVYLTFDDGPSKYTADILDMLDTYNVKATFFVIGKKDKHSKEMYKRIVEEGHSLGIHSFSHAYDKIYNSLEDFEKDFTKLSDLLYDTTGYIPYLYRFPGGSGNSVSKVDIQELIQFLDNESIVYFDWNVVNGDATGIEYSPEELYRNVMNGIKLHNTSIVLMHDTNTKGNTVKSLESILKTLTEQNVNVLPLTVDVTPIKQVK
jgi:peptidoglycan/xylan/chitin deacetylase (PgdA/CDA1 family)